MCGIVGVFDLHKTGNHDLPKMSLDLLKGNKNRGQEGYGVSVLTEVGEILTYKFQDIYDPNIYQALQDIQGKIIGIIGHARYPTSGGRGSGDEYTQPFSVKTRERGFAFAFNGNIVNASDLAREQTSLPVSDDILDTQVLQDMIIKIMDHGETDTKRVQESIHNRIDGQCNMILMKDNGSFTLAKDRWGFRPVSYHYNPQDGFFAFSSESHALFKIGINPKDIEHLNTGESVQYNSKSQRLIVSDMSLDVPNQKSRCFFETVYFADPETILWKEPSTNHRYRLGQELARGDSNYFSREDTVVIDVPASSLSSAKGYAESIDLVHLSSAITKNPHASRTFISDDASRQKKIEEKYIFNPELKKYIQGKKLVLIDDSIVRGSTLEYLIQQIQDFYEPSEIHIRIPSPPITGPCYYAINLKHPSELLARKFFIDSNNPTLEEFENLAKYFGVHSIKYVNKDQMIQALRVNVKDMCLGCITGKYPTPSGQALFETQIQEKEAN